MRLARLELGVGDLQAEDVHSGQEKISLSLDSS